MTKFPTNIVKGKIDKDELQVYQTDTARYIANQKPDDPGMIELNWIRTEFNLPPSIIAKCSVHYMRVWDGEYVGEIAVGGTMQHAGHEWIAHYQSSRVVVLNAKRVACSFREYNGKRYVVIKVWKGEGA